MDPCARDRSRLILGVSDHEDLRENCFYMKGLGRGQASLLVDWTWRRQFERINVNFT